MSERERYRLLGRSCKLLLGFASAAVLVIGLHGAHDHIFLSHDSESWDFFPSFYWHSKHTHTHTHTYMCVCVFVGWGEVLALRVYLTVPAILTGCFAVYLSFSWQLLELFFIMKVNILLRELSNHKTNLRSQQVSRVLYFVDSMLYAMREYISYS
jgi:hypothetical protein